MCKTQWKLAQNHYDMEIFLEDGMVRIKEWFDPGKNPNMHKFTFQEFLDGKFNYEIMMAFNGWIVTEIKENIRKLLNKEENN